MIEALKALANPHRLAIVQHLCGTEKAMNVGQIADLIKMSQPVASQHLKILLTAQILATRKQQTTVFYRLNVDMPTSVWHLVRFACEVQ